jgi:membrane-bound metal-dependent hydrolase YbcI (DUF457 family)
MPSPAGHMMSGLFIAAIPASITKKFNYKYFALAAFISVVPDLDMLLVLAGINYFDAHRTFSHSIVSVLIVFALLWSIAFILSKKQISALNIPYRLIGTCLMCHIGIDLLGVDERGPQGLMLLWPFSNDFFYPAINLYPSTADKYGNILPLSSLVVIAYKEFMITILAGSLIFSSVFLTNKIINQIRNK